MSDDAGGGRTFVPPPLDPQRWASRVLEDAKAGNRDALDIHLSVWRARPRGGLDPAWAVGGATLAQAAAFSRPSAVREIVAEIRGATGAHPPTHEALGDVDHRLALYAELHSASPATLMHLTRIGSGATAETIQEAPAFNDFLRWVAALPNPSGVWAWIDGRAPWIPALAKRRHGSGARSTVQTMTTLSASTIQRIQRGTRSVNPQVGPKSDYSPRK